MEDEGMTPVGWSTVLSWTSCCIGTITDDKMQRGGGGGGGGGSQNRKGQKAEEHIHWIKA